MPHDHTPGKPVRHFPFNMLKEIYEQPDAISETIERHLDGGTGAIHIDRAALSSAEWASLRSITIAASGSSRHAGLCGKLMIEDLAGIPVSVEHASEYGHRKPLNSADSLVIVITQSGETADTTAALRLAKEYGRTTLAVTNVENSTIAHEADANFLTFAGKEAAIPATKSFTAQLTAMYMLALFITAQKKTVAPEVIHRRIGALREVPVKLRSLLDSFDTQARTIAEEYRKDEAFIYLGRDVHYAIALEGALKLKETAYVHAEGYPTGELRHGPTALLDESLPVVAIVTRDTSDPDSMLRYERSLSLLREIWEHSKRLILIASQGDNVCPTRNSCFAMAEVNELLLPIFEVVPLQLLAYHMAVLRNFNPDRPRNLVKAVTVE